MFTLSSQLQFPANAYPEFLWLQYKYWIPVLYWRPELCFLLLALAFQPRLLCPRQLGSKAVDGRSLTLYLCLSNKYFLKTIIIMLKIKIRDKQTFRILASHTKVLEFKSWLQCKSYFMLHGSLEAVSDALRSEDICHQVDGSWILALAQPISGNFGHLKSVLVHGSILCLSICMPVKQHRNKK